MGNYSLIHLTPEEKKAHKKAIRDRWLENNKEKCEGYYQKRLISKRGMSNYKSRPREFKDKKNELGRKIYSENKDKINARRRELFKLKMQNPRFRKLSREKSESWKINNKEKYRESHRKSDIKARPNVCERVKKKRKTNELFRIKEVLHARIRRFFNGRTKIKVEDKEHLLGANKPFIKKHLERQFKKGMTWENYGHKGWHIDHIIPLSSAKTEEELRALFHYTNLQPLWAKDNLTKSAKLPKNHQIKMTI